MSALRCLEGVRVRGVREEVLPGVNMVRPSHIDQIFPNITLSQEFVSVKDLTGVLLDFSVAAQMEKFIRVDLIHDADLMPVYVSVYPGGIWEPGRKWNQAQEAAFLLTGAMPSDEDVCCHSSVFLRQILHDAGVSVVPIFRYRK